MPPKRPAHLILEFPKDEVGFWVAVLEDTTDSEYRLFANQFTGRLQVTSFSLEDHQFIYVHLKRKKSGKESVMWIPRSIVTGIVEGKAAAISPYDFWTKAEARSSGTGRS